MEYTNDSFEKFYHLVIGQYSIAWYKMLIKFTEQIAKSFVKKLMVTKKFKTLSNIWDEAFSVSRYWIHSQTENVAKHLRWWFLQKQLKTKSRSLFLQNP